MNTPPSPLLRAAPRLRTNHSPSSHHSPFSDPGSPCKASKYTRMAVLSAALGITLLAATLHLPFHHTPASPALLHLLHSRSNASAPAPAPPTSRPYPSWLTRYHYMPRNSRNSPVRVALMTPHFFGPHYAGLVPNCTYLNQPLTCVYYEPAADTDARPADVLWYHAPGMCDIGADGPTRLRDGQLTAVASMESAAYYPCLDSPEYMAQFDIELTYRMCSQVPLHYLAGELAHLPTLQQPPLPFDAKHDAIAFINSNCEPLSGRQRVVDAYLALNASIPLHAYGTCSNNMGGPAPADKLAVFRRYKFCICMENSIAADYVTEKLWHGLAAGCVPIYLGAPNVLDFVPDRGAIVDYAQVGSVAALAELVERLARDRVAYEAMLAWKRRPLAALSAGFQHLLARSEYALEHSRCQLCQLAAAQRARPVRHTTCLFNETWKAQAHGGHT